jgi:NADPH:quinone reductase-like Zn-dependent oxidoreductase
MIASGAIHVPVAATYPLAAIKEAIGHVKRGGRVLLNVKQAN